MRELGQIKRGVTTVQSELMGGPAIQSIQAQMTGGGQIAKSDDQETGVHIETSLRLRKNQDENNAKKNARASRK